MAEANTVGLQDSLRSGCRQLRYSLLEAGQIPMQDGVPEGWQTSALQCRYTWRLTSQYHVDIFHIRHLPTPHLISKKLRKCYSHLPKLMSQ